MASDGAIMPFHARFLALTAAIEQRFAVNAWHSGDADLWPLARMDLYLDMLAAQSGERRAKAAKWRRALIHLARPATNVWRGRKDFRSQLMRPHPADAIFLGDGVSMDYIGGKWEDRYAEPLMAALEKQGRSSFFLQPGDLKRTPCRRPFFAANRIEAAAQWLAPFCRAPLNLPDHDALSRFLAQQQIVAPSLSHPRLARRAAILRAQAYLFGRILDKVKPRLAFCVTWYAGQASAFALACRRRGILSVDLQHCPQGRQHKAYHWSNLPALGYRTMPALFWNWQPEDAAQIASWCHNAWHQSLFAGHPRLADLSDAHNGMVPLWERDYRAQAGSAAFDREILVALQTLQGQKSLWENLATYIAAAPKTWRWWIRRHPAATFEDDASYRRLLALQGANIMIDAATSLPLPALLRHMDLVLSIASGVAAEAQYCGVPAIFLSLEAQARFGDLIDLGAAHIATDIHRLDRLIRMMPPVQHRALRPQPSLASSLARLDLLADGYAQICRTGAGE